MKKNYFLGLAANQKKAWEHLFVRASANDSKALKQYLTSRYGGETMLCKNGRSALTLALKAYFNKGDKIIINGFTCYAVYEAVKAAGLTPVFADISKNDLNFNTETLKKVIDDDTVGVIVQNTLGNPVDMKTIEHFAGKYGLVIIEDLAHCVGVNYPDGREVGTVGAATVLSFGKDKSIDTTSGGSVIFRYQHMNKISQPELAPRTSDYLRERFYPLFGLLCRKLTRVHLGGIMMRALLKLHFVERSADNRLDLTRRPAHFEAKLALRQLKTLKNEKPLRSFYLVDNREEVLAKLKAAGYFFDGFWYEKPVSPERYYKKVHFDEEKCPVATEVAKKIVNLPNYYSKKELAGAMRIIESHGGEKNGQ